MTTTITPTTSSSTATRVEPIRFANSLRVECRKVINTRAGQFIAAGGLALMGAFGIGLAAVTKKGTEFTQIATTALGPATWLIFVLATLLIAHEFGRGSATHTFTLDPNRSRVLAAKALTVVLIALALVAAALVIAVLAWAVVPALGGPSVALTLSWQRLAQGIGGMCFAGLVALAWGLLLRNAPAPLVLLLVWPTISHILRNLSIAPLLDWVNIEPVWSLDGSALSWAKLASSALVWLVLPGAIGAYRLVKGDL